MKVSIAAAKLLWRRLLVRGGHGDGVEVVSEVAVPGQASQTGQCEGLTPQSG
ncbi:hypothetical protein VD0002_g5143 [Verticillium dahliae]|nr:hypothetical protein VD0003_g8122 [Verticillium dahliae]PNH63094.1 hypothetical protein VD0002_g5143 [Verticillium dahliae]